MVRFISMVSLLCGVIPSLIIVAGLEVVLDVKNDEWAIGGQSIYAETGEELRSAAISQYLPQNFPYDQFDSANGIWIVFPDYDKDCANGSLTTTTTEAPCDISNFVSFQYTLPAMLEWSVHIWYTYGIKASIRVSTIYKQHPFEAQANNMQTLDPWTKHTTIKFVGDKVLVEAIVGDTTGAFILIDKIIIETTWDPPIITSTNTPSTLSTSSTTSSSSTTQSTPQSTQGSFSTIQSTKPTQESSSIIPTTLKPTETSSSTIPPTGQPGSSTLSGGQSSKLTMFSGNLIVSCILVTMIVIRKSLML